jgi:hypothetical protein
MGRELVAGYFGGSFCFRGRLGELLAENVGKSCRATLAVPALLLAGNRNATRDPTLRGMRHNL